MEPLVSILVPAYNAERWIADTLESALAQTWRKKEIIVVDDGSSDRTLQIAKQFASKAVRVVTQANQGASGARNTAFSVCQGDYIQWLDADDLMGPDKIARQMEAIQRCQSRRTLFSSSWGYFFYRLNRAEFTPTPLWCDLSPAEWLIRKMGQNLHMQTATWLVSRELTEAAGPWDIRLWKDNDGEYFCRVILASDGIRFISEAKTFYRRSDYNSVTNIGRSNRKLESQFLSMRLHVHYLRSLDDSERARVACVNYLQTWFPRFYQRPDIVEQLEQLASNLGGQLRIPRLSWKYAWIQKIFGWKLAKKAQLVAQRRKEGLLRSWDKAMSQLENQTWVGQESRSGGHRMEQ
jgi:glycosyltransferase involved in cell wall biosynthesis